MPAPKPEHSAVLRWIIHSYIDSEGNRDYEVYFQEHFTGGFLSDLTYDWIDEEFENDIDDILEDVFQEPRGGEFFAEVVIDVSIVWDHYETMDGPETDAECTYTNPRIKYITEEEANNFLKY